MSSLIAKWDTFKKSHKIAIMLLVVLLLTNPSLKNFKEEYGERGQICFNALLFSCYKNYTAITSSTGIRYDSKTNYFIGVLGNIIYLG